jgi:hypothetical protein
MTTTYELIGSASASGGSVSSFEFTSIPSTFDDLCVIASLRGNQSATTHGTVLQFNSNSSSYSSRYLYGTGSAAGSSTNTTWDGGMEVGNCAGNTATASTFSNLEIYIPNYAGSTNKSVSVSHVTEHNGASLVGIYVIAGLWSNTATISSLKVYPYTPHGTSFLQYSSAYLYGITK